MPSIKNKELKYRFLLLDLLYLCLTYIWIFLLPLSGDEFTISKNLHESFLQHLPFHITSNPTLIRLTNFITCYCVMVTIYFITRELTSGPWWLGSLSAVVFMAHPILNPQISHPIFSKSLLDLLFGLTSVYAILRGKKQKLALILALILAPLSIYFSPYNTMLILCALILSIPNEKSQNIYFYLVSMVLLLVSGITIYMSKEKFSFIVDIFPNFSLLVYPIGWLKESQSLYKSSSIYPLVSNLAILATFGLLAYLLRNFSVLPLLIVITLLLSITPQPYSDLSYPLKNTHLVYPLVFFTITLAHICGIIQTLPKWNSPIVKLTTLLCIIMILFQFYLHFEKGYTIYKERKIVAKLMEKVESLKCKNILLLPAKIEYRWSSINIYSSAYLLKEKYPNLEYTLHPVGKIENPDYFFFSIFWKNIIKDPLTFRITSPNTQKIKIENYQPPLYFYKNLNTLPKLLVISDEGKIEICIQLKENITNKCVFIWDQKKTGLMEIKDNGTQSSQI
ncbi:MAG: hypothetical protein N3G21_13595 [Candidatus Hydrogenedentes bacterium]|nr:hypothetical protein [Candidatus Hydrogenedentota bacterium]